jgi:uncharacterized protein (DUF58 family)
MVLLTVAILGYSYAVFAEKLDVDQKIREVEGQITQQGAEVKKALTDVNVRLTTIEWTQEQRFIEQRLATIESEVYQLERIVVKGEGTPRDNTRLDNLKIEFNQMTRKLEEKRRQAEIRMQLLQ